MKNPFSGFTRRKLVDPHEHTVSFLQIIGFLLMLSGIVYLLSNLLFDAIDGQEIAINFMIIMLGFSFAFPTLLEGNEGLSTMRIVVFMTTTVICMLLLKVGWQSATLQDIGLDEYWVGVIAFIFGAKATQSFFESRMTEPKQSVKLGMAGLQYSHADTARIAIAQNEQLLKMKFPNIVSISDAVDDLGKGSSHVVALYLKDDNTAGIPSSLQATMPDGSKQIIATEIITDVGGGGIHIAQQDQIKNGHSEGSVCCIAETEDGDRKVVTAGHVFSKGRSKNYGGELGAQNQLPATVNGQGVGNWFFQIINGANDVAMAGIDNWADDRNLISFQGKGHYTITDKDVDRKTPVTLVSNAWGSKIRTGYILDHNTTWDIRYDDNIEIRMNKVVIVGGSPSRLHSMPVSKRGDSGGCVYEPVSGQLVGLILGGNDKFTWVLPLKDIFESYNYQLV